MGANKSWTPTETEYLSENWGRISVKTIAAKLDRSINAVIVRKNRLGLGAFLDNGDYVTVNQLYKALGKTGGVGYTNTSWIENRGLPVKLRTVNDCKFKVIHLDDFWKWADKHRNFIDWSKFEPLSLGAEPPWVKEQRKICHKTKSAFRTTPWTPDEDSRLHAMLKMHKFTVDEISKTIGRTAGAIQRRCCDLNFKERPVKAGNHTKWAEAEYLQLGEFIKQGYREDGGVAQN